MDITVTGLVVRPNLTPNRQGDRIVAFFDAQIEWLQMRGGALVRLNSGGYGVWEPRLEGDDRRRMQLTPIVRRELVEKVMPVYEQFGGPEMEAESK